MKTRIPSLATRPLSIGLLAVQLAALPPATGAQYEMATPAATPAALDTAPPITATIALGERVSIDGDGASAGESGVTITSGGTFLVRGDLLGGTLAVDAPGADVNLLFDGATIASDNGPAVHVRAAASATVSLAAGSANALSDGGDTDADAALYSDAPLTIRGLGALAVEGNQNEGIASTSHITIEGGDLRVWASEDGLNANEDGVSEITITGGSLFVTTDTGDAIDSNGIITITGGTVVALGALADANGGLDADGPVTIDGGAVIATGARQPAPDASSAQPSLFVDFGQDQPAGTLVVIRDESGKDVLAFAPEIPFRHLLVSDPAIAEGVSYTVSIGGAADGIAPNGIAAGPITDPGTVVATVTTDSVEDARSRRR